MTLHMRLGIVKNYRQIIDKSKYYANLFLIESTLYDYIRKINKRLIYLESNILLSEESLFAYAYPVCAYWE